MPIGAVLGGVGVVGSFLSSNSANKNAKRAAQTSEQNNAANIALQRESRDMALQRLDPFTNNGLAAGNQINALLGIGGGQVQPSAAGQWGLGDSPGMTASPQQNAFDMFRNSTGYRFRLGEGLDAVNSGYAGSGVLQSGAALRGINEYGQNFASNEFGNYMNALANQQAVGAGAASSGAGVQQNFANMATNSNNQNAQNQMYAQLGKQNPFANALGTASGLGFGFLTGGR